MPTPTTTPIVTFPPITVPVTTPASSYTYTVTGLTAGLTYTFSVRAVNKVGEGPRSNLGFATPYSTPIPTPTSTPTSTPTATPTSTPTPTPLWGIYNSGIAPISSANVLVQSLYIGPPPSTSTTVYNGWYLDSYNNLTPDSSITAVYVPSIQISSTPGTGSASWYYIDPYIYTLSPVNVASFEVGLPLPPPTPTPTPYPITSPWYSTSTSGTISTSYNVLFPVIYIGTSSMTQGAAYTGWIINSSGQLTPDSSITEVYVNGMQIGVLASSGTVENWYYNGTSTTQIYTANIIAATAFEVANVS